jgi:hypothetical protein
MYTSFRTSRFCDATFFTTCAKHSDTLWPLVSAPAAGRRAQDSAWRDRGSQDWGRRCGTPWALCASKFELSCRQRVRAPNKTGRTGYRKGR